MDRINKTSLRSQINYVCVDQVKPPPQITDVPTLILNPNTPPIVGDQIFHWLENVRQRSASSQSGGGPAAAPVAYSLEMGNNLSDNYSFLGNDQISHNFEYLGAGNGSIATPNEGEQANPKDDVSQKMERMMAERDNDLGNSVQRI